MPQDDRTEPTAVAVAGDWHGDRSWAIARIQSLGKREIRTILHAGDFGIWPGPQGKAYLQAVDKVCAKYGMEIQVTPGNHEDWGRLSKLWENPRNRDDDGTLRPLHLTDHVTVLPRGYRWCLGGRTFVSLGGAPSVDFPFRTPGKDWWAEEQMTQEDVEKVATAGSVDVMITHDAPGPPWATDPVRRILATNPMGWTDRALAYAAVGRELVTEAFTRVVPHLLIHGHYHCSGQSIVRLPRAGYDTTIWSLDCNGKAGNVRILDLVTLSDPRTSTHPPNPEVPLGDARTN